MIYIGIVDGQPKKIYSSIGPAKSLITKHKDPKNEINGKHIVFYAVDLSGLTPILESGRLEPVQTETLF